MSRDQLYDKMKQNGIFGSRYFYPLITEFSMYKGLDSAKPGNLQTLAKIADEVICLPIYPALEDESVARIVSIITGKK